VIIFIFISIVADAGVGTTSTTYISYVDDNLGFYKVRNLDQPPRQFTYIDHILNINKGDTVIWQNDADKTTFTILSNQNLWDNNIGYLRVGSKMNYKFDKPGKYTLYVKEYSSIRQTIIVGATDEVPDTDIVVAITNTPFPTIYITTPVPTYVSTYIPRVTYIPKTTVSTINFTMIASIIVSILSIFIIFRVRRNK
jgi:plastocyanin